MLDTSLQLLRQQKIVALTLVPLLRQNKKYIDYIVTVTKGATAMGAESTERPSCKQETPEKLPCEHPLQEKQPF